jgi:hypothetical protein
MDTRTSHRSIWQWVLRAVESTNLINFDSLWFLIQRAQKPIEWFHLVMIQYKTLSAIIHFLLHSLRFFIVQGSCRITRFKQKKTCALICVQIELHWAKTFNLITIWFPFNFDIRDCEIYTRTVSIICARSLELRAYGARTDLKLWDDTIKLTTKLWRADRASLTTVIQNKRIERQPSTLHTNPVRKTKWDQQRREVENKYDTRASGSHHSTTSTSCDLMSCRVARHWVTEGSMGYKRSRTVLCHIAYIQN